jgi:hypothetical protein
MSEPAHKGSRRESRNAGVNSPPSNGRKSEPVRLGEILPEVMRNIRNRMERIKGKVRGKR